MVGWNIVISDFVVVASWRGRGGDAEDGTILHLSESTAVDLDLAIKPLWGEMKSDVVIVDVVKLVKLAACNMEQVRVVSRLGDKVSAFTMDENENVRHSDGASGLALGM